MVAGRARASLHLSLQNAVWGAGCCALETTFHLDSILWKNCLFMAQRRGQFLKGASPQKQSAVLCSGGLCGGACLSGSAGVRGVSRCGEGGGEVTEGNLKVDGGGEEARVHHRLPPASSRDYKG